MLKRKAYDELVFWKDTKTTQAMLVTGARQVGKTYLIREFAKENYESFVEINLIDSSEARQSFNAATSSSDLFTRITVEARSELVPKKTLVFIDEVQEANEVVTFIKFLVERDDFDYILSGSMLGVELKSVKSVPVGYLHILEMFPLDFQEFCWANGISQAVFDQMTKCYTAQTPVEDYLHNKLLNLFHQYLIVGGMPEPVSQFTQTGNLQAVRRLQANIIELYRRDISQYSDEREARAIRQIYDLIPNELSQQNKRFVINSIDGKTKFTRNENRFLWLVDADVALAAHNVREPRHPLLLSVQANFMKLFLSDVGLLTSLCGMDVVRDTLNSKPGVNYGALYENAIAQEITAQGFKLFYFKNKKLGELDFVIEHRNGEVIPIEVKSGKDYNRHRALDNVLEVSSFGINQAIVFHEGNIVRKSKILYLPVYMVSCLSCGEDLG